MRDGFLFGMAANAKLLLIDSQGSPSRQLVNPLEILDPHVQNLIQPLQSSQLPAERLTELFKEYTGSLHRNTLAHPNDPNAPILSEHTDPLAWICRELCNELYFRQDLPTTEANAQSTTSARHFGYGYAVARASMNAYRLQTIHTLTTLFEDSHPQ